MNDESLLVGDSRQMREAREFCALFGPRRITVLVIGASGCGKSEAAAELHRYSGRAVFRRISAAELVSREMMQVILAGAIKGSYTSIERDRVGLLDSPAPMTVFLDDLQDLPLECQVYLLDCVEGEALRVYGTERTFRPDVRWVIGSQQPLAALVLAGKLRRDLVARTGVAELRLPSLRERIGDVVQLAPHFLARLAAKESLAVPVIGGCAMKALLDYDWPDNVRELETTLHYALVMASAGNGGALLAEHLPARILAHLGRTVVQETQSLDRITLLRALDANDWVITRGAAQLGLDRQTVYRKMRALGIARPPRA